MSKFPSQVDYWIAELYSEKTPLPQTRNYEKRLEELRDHINRELERFRRTLPGGNKSWKSRSSL